jgi:hypothetical protein
MFVALGSYRGGADRLTLTLKEADTLTATAQSGIAGKGSKSNDTDRKERRCVDRHP